MIKTLAAIVLILAMLLISREVAMLFEPGVLRYVVGYCSLALLLGIWRYNRERLVCFFGGLLLWIMELLKRADDERY